MQWLLHVLLASFVWQSVAISLRSNSSGTRTTAAAGLRKPGCGCDANSPSWHKTSRTQPKCVFIDLGAADGNTFDNFLADGYGPVSNCPHGGDWEAILVEANPVFSKKLKSLEANLGGKVRSLASTAAYSCETTTTFSIDADPTHNFWASSLDEKVGQQEVTVPTINVNKLIAENVRPDDWVILKVDIEGAEYEVMPCLAEFKDAELIDEIFLEEHWWFPDRTREQNATMVLAKDKLKSRKIRIPAYFSNS
ncbi:hypothetical protein AK812_SmicGene41285 [Symbiodinium microadriaticum]|uniref:Methyltransferase FkbM domain-containing protein n=1 Tax=Symbiodinium microadriaticum TaxID=2951 RepID=A0A1Q9C6H3_SYMMI|nr:hypothetical protein AK812_SmicGene41285 [Symbiodinium microadriaticum]